MTHKKVIVGIDEVGRGPLAGPVSVGVVMLPSSRLSAYGRVRDSKQLSASARERIAEKVIGDKQAKVAVASVSARVIDRIGIVPAIRLATLRAMRRLKVPHTATVLLDGGLRAPSLYKNQKIIIRGDETKTIIALASIVAKVHRDGVMVGYDKRYPQYGFAEHKGYGTKAHYRALKKNGMTPLHRWTFLSRNIE